MKTLETILSILLILSIGVISLTYLFKRIIEDKKYNNLGPGSKIKVRINSLTCSCIREAIVQHKTEKDEVVAHLTKKEIESCKNCNKGSNCWYWVKTFKRKDIIV